MRKKTGEPTIKDLMMFLQTFETKIMGEFHDMRQDIDHLKQGQYSLQQELVRIKERLTSLEKRTTEDSDVYAKEVIELRTRVRKLEKEFEKIKAQR